MEKLLTKSRAEKQEKADKEYAAKEKKDMDEHYKRMRVEQHGETRKDELSERFKERAASVSGQGIDADSMARMGGFTGPQREGMQKADRGLKLAELSTEYQKELVRLTGEVTQRLAELKEGNNV
jgi:hypothetical protein